MVWEINATHEFSSWLASLFEEEKLSVVAAVELLPEGGPTLWRPTVERSHSSRYHNMKYLRPRAAGKHLRVLFMFDPPPLRQAILLYGGSKAQRWNDWYGTAIPAAERFYRQYLAELGVGRGIPDL